MSHVPVPMRCSKCGSGDFLQPSLAAPLDIVLCLRCERAYFFAAFIDQHSAAGRFTRCLFDSMVPSVAGDAQWPLPRHADSANP